MNIQNNLSPLRLFDDILKVYKFPEQNLQRYSSLQEKFTELYNIKPQYVARAPGRVNLIGEHIDYMGYGVLPFALEQDCIMAFSYSSEWDQIEVNHLDPHFPPQSFSKDPNALTEFINPYLKYLWAGYRAAVGDTNTFVGIKVLVSGNVPIAAGLSSSSSLVVCSGIMSLFANNQSPSIDKFSFVDKLIVCERQLGTACGGMDQSISLMGDKDKALYIEFNPLKTEPVQLPSNIAFIICDSLTPSKKLETLGTRYNKRVCECRMAIALICKKMSIEKRYTQFQQLQNDLNLSLENMIKLVQDNIENRPYTVQEIESILGYQVTEIISDVIQYEVVLEVNKEFLPYSRGLHVLTESLRVDMFRKVGLDSAMDNDQKVQKLGQLMNESHQSCRDQYDCSSLELDELTNLCRQNGAFGSRLTGAGWGGCCVSMIDVADMSGFIEKISKQYFELKGVSGDQLKNKIFATAPSNGALILKL